MALLPLMFVVAVTAPPEPCRAPDPLAQRDPLLQLELADALREPRLAQALAKHELAVAVVDLTRDDWAYYAGINDDEMMYAASLPKIAILLTDAEAAEKGRLAWTPDTRYRLHRMVVVSDNGYAAWGADSVGLTSIAALMQSPETCLYVPPAGGLWVGRSYRKGGPTLRDPMHNLSHGATARQVARFYTMMERGHLLSPGWSTQLAHLMAPPGHAHKLVAALGKIPGVAFVARKSGTWTSYHSDSALIDHYGRRYVVAVLANAWDGESLVRRVGEACDSVIMKGEHRRGRVARVDGDRFNDAFARRPR